MKVTFKTLDGLECEMDVPAVYRGVPPMQLQRPIVELLPRLEKLGSMPCPSFSSREYQCDRWMKPDGTMKYVYTEQKSKEVQRLERQLAEKNKEIERLTRELGEAWTNALQQGDEF